MTPTPIMYRVTEFRKTVHVEQAVKILDRVNEHEVSVMVGEAPAIREIRRTIARAAPTDVTILITGESGVGKEVIATASTTPLTARASPL